MKTVLITGAAGFVGRNLVAALKRRDDVRLVLFDVNTEPGVLDAGLAEADLIYHLAGVNRPKDESEFVTGNTGLTEQMLARLAELVASRSSSFPPRPRQNSTTLTAGARGPPRTRC
jgi:UDP-2-acetamido-2,6-beta-L-arabino-hexul-4-ose reductase